jgi:hypothetical protein
VVSIAAYWAPKIESKLVSAFTLDDMTLTGDGVEVDYQSHEGKPVRIQFRFSPSGKILHTNCGHCDSTSAFGPFETCRRHPKMSVDRGRPEVTGRLPNRRF